MARWYPVIAGRDRVLTFRTADRRSAGYGSSRVMIRPAGERPSAPAPIPSRPVARAVKHSFDKLAAALGLLVVAPILLGVALALRFWGPGSVIRSRERVGEAGRLVSVRSFAITVEMCQCSRGWRLLSRSGVTALPQLWNVLKGELSIVGPRPRQLGFAPPPSRPGLAGLAQLTSLERRLSLAEQLELDETYARTWSLRLDVQILGRTVRRSLAP
jgi:lipopolysaccharide/colanic/teichoic acid biosynthesis glycosyltransferase